jgi:hypothetical protein
VGRLADDFETWRRRVPAEDHIQYLQMDGWYPKVRVGKRRVRVPVLVTLGVRADGQRLRQELAEDYRRMIDAETRALVDQTHTRFAKKWRLLCPGVIECLAGRGEKRYGLPVRFLPRAARGSG